MNKEINWNEVNEAQEYPKVKPGGYICQIMDIQDNEKQMYLKIYYDIVDGEFKGHYSRLQKEMKFSLPFFIRSYKSAALPFFKGMLTSLAASNKGFEFDNEPEKLVGKYIGLVLGEEEYMNAEGDIKTALKPQKIRSIKAIQDGDFKTPDLKKWKPKENVTAWQPLDNEELPF